MRFRLKRGIAAVASLILLAVVILSSNYSSVQIDAPRVAGENTHQADFDSSVPSATETLKLIPVKGRAPQTGYSRDEFGGGWNTMQGCSIREVILNRDLSDVVTNDKCQVISGTLYDPYTNKVIDFKRGVNSSSIQIDHVVALGNAWQTGAQRLAPEERNALANDPLELLAVDGSANQQKSDGDAATWLPSNKSFRCYYVARQIAVKHKYQLWVTQAEHEAMNRVLSNCPGQLLPTP